MKNRWAKPEMIVLVKSKPEEAFLVCKSVAVGGATGETLTTGLWSSHGSEFGACQPRNGGVFRI
jgi:hypothetical protein